MSIFIFTFSLSQLYLYTTISIIIPKKNNFYNKDCFWCHLKKLDYIFFVILLVSLKYIIIVSLVCYNLKERNKHLYF